MQNRENIMKLYISTSKAVCIILVVIAMAAGNKASAQLLPFGSQYFFNQYLANPAFAGAEEGFTGNAVYRSQFSAPQGSPVTQALTAEYGFGNRVGAGLNIYNDKAGILKRTRAVATYAYHLPLNEEGSKMHFGLSVGITSERLNTEDIVGDMSDPSIARFNNASAKVDGDFGIAYTGNKFNIQAALPNMRQLFKKDETNAVNWTVFYTALSYKFELDENGETSLEPKAAYRGVRGYDNIFDAGANLAVLDEQLYFSAIYHTSKNATFGFGVNVKKYKIAVLANYTTNTASMSNYTNGAFNVGLRVNLGTNN
jgi:type IX secretion system PorP/SprF family membrane protein